MEWKTIKWKREIGEGKREIRKKGNKKKEGRKKEGGKEEERGDERGRKEARRLNNTAWNNHKPCHFAAEKWGKFSKNCSIISREYGNLWKT